MSNASLEETGQRSHTALFRWPDILLLGARFLLLVIAANVVVRFVCTEIVEFDCPPRWPVSEGYFRTPRGRDLFAVLAVGAVFYLTVRHLPRVTSKIAYVVVVGTALVLGTNLIQGVEDGLVRPIAGGGEEGIQYYQDAIQIQNPAAFLADYEQLQPELLLHSRTHPPGAVLLIYGLNRLLGRPWLVSAAIGIVSATLTAVFMQRILVEELANAGLSRYVTLLLLLVPAIQVYYVASLDAVIASLLLGVLYCAFYARSRASLVGLVLLLLFSSFLTFGWIFVLPIVFGFEILKRKGAWRSSISLLSVIAVYAFVYAISGFNYARSFSIASALENPEGFRLFSEPASYLFTRLEGVFEILLFYGPFLGALTIRGLRGGVGRGSGRTMSAWAAVGRYPTLVLTGLAVLTLLGTLVTGAFKTGETARVCSFIYPYLMFPVARYLTWARPTLWDRKKLLYLVFAQTLLMQTFGHYFW
jgi:hypothetical protein